MKYVLNNAVEIVNAEGQRVLEQITSTDLRELGFEADEDFRYDTLKHEFYFKRKRDRDDAVARIAEHIERVRETALN